MKKFSIEFRRLTELDDYKGVRVHEGDRAYISPCYRQALLSNPFCHSAEVPCQKVGYINGKIGGTEIQFPLNISVDGTIVLAGSGSLTQVDEWARSSGLGLAISDVDCRDDAYNCFLGEGAGLSQIAVKVHRFIGYTVFEYPRLIMLLKSRAVVEMKLKGVLGTLVSCIADACIWIYAKIICILARCFGGHTKVMKVEPSKEVELETLASIASEGTHRFFEVHDAQWFRWVLTNSFSEQGSAVAYLVYDGDVPIGFFMVKKRFHEQASHRGFKNVWLGSVVEWGCKSGCEKKLMWKIVSWAMNAREDLDAVEFAAQEPYVQKFLRRLGWQHVGDTNFCFKICPESGMVEPDGMNQGANWRLRPGMGDVALN